ncbi:hypothetical protein ABPG75_007316 [Micractinium tetrahymenae]
MPNAPRAGAMCAMEAESLRLQGNVLFAPVSLGMDLPPMYRSLLDPYTRHKPMSFSALSSRERMLTSQPRCFERAVLCNIVNMWRASRKHYGGQLMPKSAGRRAVEYFSRKFPEEFAAQHQLAAADSGAVFRVAFHQRSNGMRQIRNLEQVMQECRQWKPPEGSPFKSVDCVLLPDGTPDNHVKLIAQVQNVHAMVGTHGSGLAYSFFMPNGSGLVEVLSWSFHGQGCTWADQYFRLVADKDHVFRGSYGNKSIHVSSAYARDADVEIFFPTLAEALQKIALGELHTTPLNRKERTFHMRRLDM